MNRFRKIILVSIILVTIMIGIYYTTDNHSENAINGVVDGGDSIVADRMISLDGQWHFYWSQLLEPIDFVTNIDHESMLLSVPSNWKRINGIDEKGYGTYRLTLEHLTVDKEYGLVINNIRIASKIFIDGKLVNQDGVPSNDGSTEVMGNIPKTIHFIATNSTTDIIIQVSNFSYYSGGIVESIKFGSLDILERNQKFRMVYEVGIFTYLIVIAITLGILVIFFREFRNQEISSYFMPLTVGAFTVINGALGERLIKVIFVELSMERLIQIEFIAICILLISQTISIHLMDEVLLSRRVTTIVTAIYTIFMFIVILTGMENKFIWDVVSIVTLIVLPIKFLIVLYYYINDEKISIKIEEHTLILLILYLINLYNIDVFMFTIGITYNMNLALVTSVLFGLVWFLLIVYRYSLTIKRNNEISNKLLESYYDIERNTLAVRRNEMAFLQAQIKPHFLFNSLSSIIGLCTYDPKRAQTLLMNLSLYLKHLFDIERDSEYISLDSELDLVKTYVTIEKERFGKRFDFDLTIKNTTEGILIVPLLIQPLVENAIRHGALKRVEKGQVQLSIIVEEHTIQVQVMDNGPGFKKSRIEEIFGNTQAKDDNSIGVGLVNINERLSLYYDEILHIEESAKGGTTVWFSIFNNKEVKKDAENHNS